MRVPWYAWIYLAYLFVLSAKTLHSAIRDDEPFWPTAADLVAAAAEIAFVVAWYRGLVFPRYWYVIALAVVFVTAWFIVECVRVVRTRESLTRLPEPEATAVVRSAISFAILRFSPALLAGVGVLRRSLGM